jgi:hypothetical protein
MNLFCDLENTIESAKATEVVLNSVIRSQQSMIEANANR